MSVYAKVLSVLFVFSLGGCATHPDSLAKADNEEEILLSEKLSFVHYGVFGTPRWEEIILPGSYKAKKRNREGVYFFGEDRPIVRITPVFNENKPHALQGGIFVPDNASEQPVLFHIFEGLTFYTIADVDAYIAQSSKREIRPVESNANVTAISTLTAQNVASMNVTPVQGGVAGALSGAIVAGTLELGKGSITHIPRVKDPVLDAKIRAARHVIGSSSTVVHVSKD